MVSTLFSSLNTNLRESEDQIDIEPTKGDQQPVLMIMQQTMPIFKDVAALWAADNDICEVSIWLDHFYQCSSTDIQILI